MAQAYNDIQEWKYKDLVGVFGGTSAKTYQVRSKADVKALFSDSEFAESDQLRFVELYMPKEDAPIALKTTAEASATTNARTE